MRLANTLDLMRCWLKMKTGSNQAPSLSSAHNGCWYVRLIERDELAAFRPTGRTPGVLFSKRNSPSRLELPAQESALMIAGGYDERSLVRRNGCIGIAAVVEEGATGGVVVHIVIEVVDSVDQA